MIYENKQKGKNEIIRIVENIKRPVISTEVKPSGEIRP